MKLISQFFLLENLVNVELETKTFLVKHWETILLGLPHKGWVPLQRKLLLERLRSLRSSLGVTFSKGRTVEVFASRMLRCDYWLLIPHLNIYDCENRSHLKQARSEQLKYGCSWEQLCQITYLTFNRRPRLAPRLEKARHHHQYQHHPSCPLLTHSPLLLPIKLAQGVDPCTVLNPHLECPTAVRLHQLLAS